MIVFYSVLSICFFWILGFSIVKVLRSSENSIVENNSLMYIFFGYAFLLTICMTLGMVLPMSLVAILVMILSIILFIVNFKEIYNRLSQESNTAQKTVAACIMIPIIVTGLPQILNNELYISLLENNDFAYYIASIDWLKTHTLLEPVEYSLSYPFYSLAEYMLKNTRIGIDITGAFFANIFNLESYQIFPIMIVIASVLIMIAVYEVIYYFTDNILVGIIFGIGAAVCGNTITLIVRQYVPQLFGMALLLITMLFLHQLFQDSEDKKNIILCGLATSGLLATYCEFAVYVVLFGIAYIIIFCLKKKINVLSLIKMFICTALFNVYGLYKAIDFNLSIFTRVSTNGASDIDPYNGNMLGLKHILTCLLGGSGWTYDYNIVHKIILIVGLLLAIACFCTVFFIPNEHKMFVLVITIVAGLLEVYFWMSRGAYQEYKHITSVSIFSICFIGLIVADLIKKIRQNKMITTIILGIFIAVIITGTAYPLKVYCESGIGVDKATMELGEAVEILVPESMEIELDNSINVADYMSAAYALKNHAVNLNTDSLSYLQYFQNFVDDDPSVYVVYSAGQKGELEENEQLIWNNRKYILIKRLWIE